MRESENNSQFVKEKNENFYAERKTPTYYNKFASNKGNEFTWL